jgi:hypothetical protein
MEINQLKNKIIFYTAGWTPWIRDMPITLLSMYSKKETLPGEPLSYSHIPNRTETHV